VTSVLIADDEELMRAGLTELLASDATISVVGQAADGHQAIDRARRLRPDVVLMDVRMPGLDGIAATERLTTAVPATKVLILTTFEDDDYIFPSLRAGASGFLLKRARPDQLISAVHTVAAGDALLSPSVTRRVIDRMARQPAPQIPGRSTLDQLTPREKDVLRLVAHGLSNREIAAELVVEDATVRSHIRRILMKLQLRDRVQIVIYAYETGVIRPAPDARPRRASPEG
jgi:DNA-binding NarL/FixJ family response regulator